MYAITKHNFGCKPATKIARIELRGFLYNQWEVIDLQVPTWVVSTGTIDYCHSDLSGQTLHLFMLNKYHITIDLTLDQEMEFWQTERDKTYS